MHNLDVFFYKSKNTKLTILTITVFSPGKRSADSESEISMIPSSYDINNSVMEDDPTVVESAQKRSVAVSRKNFRPAKRSAAFGRLRFRPAKRSAAFGRLRFRPAKRAETEWY